MEKALEIRNFLFKAFIINYIAVLFAFGLYYTGLYHWVMNIFGFGMMPVAVLIIWVLAIWKILAAVFFLVPALALHWQYGCKKKEKKAKAPAKKRK